jgi:serine protease Do
VGQEDSKENNRTGLTVENVRKELADRFGLKDSKGIVVTEVKPGSSAEDMGISVGSVIIEINGYRPESVKEYTDFVDSLKKGAVLRLLLRRPDGSAYYVAVKVE